MDWGYSVLNRTEAASDISVSDQPMQGTFPAMF
jgi:hypothetical protein